MLSFYETGVLARRATRGAGYDWGLAEEATFAAGWLCDYGVDGADVLSRYLRRVDGQTVASRMVRAWPDSWEGEAFAGIRFVSVMSGRGFVRFWLAERGGKGGYLKGLCPRIITAFYRKSARRGWQDLDDRGRYNR